MDIYWLDNPICRNPQLVGGKAANLGRLAATHPVPPGFCLTATQAAERIPPVLARRLGAAYNQLGERCGHPAPRVAVRSSAVDEDGQLASFAGQHESYLNVVGAEAVAHAVEHCLASARSDRARVYRHTHGLSERTEIAVLVQQLVLADASAVVFSVDPRTGEREHIVINATWGLGESLVGGTVTPDLYIVSKRDLRIIARQVSEKTVMTVAYSAGTREVAIPRLLRAQPALEDAQIVALARLARSLEVGEGWPVDLECAYQRRQLYLLQCRPITTLTGLATPIAVD